MKKEKKCEKSDRKQKDDHIKVSADGQKRAAKERHKKVVETLTHFNIFVISLLYLCFSCD